GAGRYIHFEPTGGSQPLGMLGIIVPKNYAGEPLQPTVWVTGDNMSGAALSLPEVRVLGRRAVTLSMKALCFLHHRDGPGAQHHCSVPEIMAGTRSVTWVDLQRLLRRQPDEHMLAILESFAKGGRLTSDQLDVAAEAVTFLRRCKQDRYERIGGGGLEPS